MHSCKYTKHKSDLCHGLLMYKCNTGVVLRCGDIIKIIYELHSSTCDQQRVKLLQSL